MNKSLRAEIDKALADRRTYIGNLESQKVTAEAALADAREKQKKTKDFTEFDQLAEEITKQTDRVNRATAWLAMAKKPTEQEDKTYRALNSKVHAERRKIYDDTMRKIRKPLKDILDTITAGEAEQDELSKAIDELAKECGIFRAPADDIEDGLVYSRTVHAIKDANIQFK